jgi:hypothetical protein
VSPLLCSREMPGWSADTHGEHANSNHKNWNSPTNKNVITWRHAPNQDPSADRDEEATHQDLMSRMKNRARRGEGKEKERATSHQREPHGRWMCRRREPPCRRHRPSSLTRSGFLLGRWSRVSFLGHRRCGKADKGWDLVPAWFNRTLFF